VPQLLLSLIRFAQTGVPVVLHTVSPVGQTHVPDTHIPPIGHAFAHAPQWFGSFDKFAHDVPQLTSPAGQVQTPAAHVAVDGHA
jgi:hypothetical protein